MRSTATGVDDVETAITRLKEFYGVGEACLAESRADPGQAYRQSLEKDLDDVFGPGGGGFKPAKPKRRRYGVNWPAAMAKKLMARDPIPAGIKWNPAMVLRARQFYERCQPGELKRLSSAARKRGRVVSITTVTRIFAINDAVVGREKFGRILAAYLKDDLSRTQLNRLIEDEGIRFDTRRSRKRRGPRTADSEKEAQRIIREAALTFLGSLDAASPYLTVEQEKSLEGIRRRLREMASMPISV